MGIIRSRWLGSVLRAVSGRVYRGARRVFAFSDDMIPLLVAYGVPESRIQVVYNGVGVGSKQPAASGQQQAGEGSGRKGQGGEAEGSRHKAQESSDGDGAHQGLPLVACRSYPFSIEVLYAGTIGIANDLTQAVQAAALLQARGRTDIHFTFLGDGNDRNRVAKVAQALDLHNITFARPVPHAEAMQRIAQADIGLCCFAPFPILESNGSSKFCDYLACGTPVVLNYRGWQGALVEAHACGLAVPQGTPAALADALTTLADDPALRARMGAVGKTLAQQRFDRTILATEMLENLQYG
jgi:glycosyltransferase involved in cell wall biosynthesis